jgi:glycosyltransferase involved in cell wall biosynthesis
VKITFVLPFINLTGGIRILLNYANWLHDAGHEVTVVYPTWPYRFHWTRRQQWTEFRNHARHDGRVPWLDLRCRLSRVPVIQTAFLPRADVVIATAWPTAHDVARLHHSRGKKVQIVFHHETGTGPEHRIRAIYSFPFHRIAFSHFVRDQLKREFDCEVHEVVPTGVDPELFFQDGDAEPHSVLFLFHPDPRKGATDGIEALSRLRGRMSHLRVHVCGTVQPDRLPPWMPFEFHPPDAVLRRRYSTSAALLYPSRHEGFGLPPLEAMACGCPSVTTAVGAVPEFAKDRRDALIVPVGDIDAMVHRLEELLNDAKLRQSLSLGGLGTAERFALSRIAPFFAGALEKAIAAA